MLKVNTKIFPTRGMKSPNNRVAQKNSTIDHSINSVEDLASFLLLLMSATLFCFYLTMKNLQTLDMIYILLLEIHFMLKSM